MPGNMYDDLAKTIAPSLETATGNPLEHDTHASEHEDGGADPVTPTLHAARHADGGADELALQDLATDTAAAGQVAASDGAGAVVMQPGIQVYTKTIAFGALGTGVSVSIPIDAFPTNVLRGPAAVEVDVAFAGEADLAVKAGDTVDDDELVAATNLNAVAAGWLAIVPGVGKWQFEPGYSGAGGDVTFTATELGDVTAGQLTIHIPYIALPLATP